MSNASLLFHPGENTGRRCPVVAQRTVKMLDSATFATRIAEGGVPMSKSENELHQECIQRFIKLANKMAKEGIATPVISAGLMSASGVYATYVFAGNEGGLNASGVDKVTAAYKEQLERVQQMKKERYTRRAGD
jgi:hypothetical protein